MHCEYASGGPPPVAARPAGSALGVGPELTLGTVGDFEPLEQPAKVTANTTAAAAQSCDGRIILLIDKPGPRASFGDRFAFG
jgi:hypothetical protein